MFRTHENDCNNHCVIFISIFVITMANLNPKQQRFCEEYIIDLNATQAAIRAGYSKKTADSQASRLLTNVKVKEYICVLQQKIQNKTGITAERVLNELAKIAFFDVRKIHDSNGQLLPIQDIDDDSAAGIAGLESYEETANKGEETFTSGIVRKIKIADKRGALNDLGRHLGIFAKDNAQVKTELNQKFIGYGPEE